MALRLGLEIYNSFIPKALFICKAKSIIENIFENTNFWYQLSTCHLHGADS